MAMIGYARVSSNGQSLDGQVQKLMAFGCTRNDIDDHIFEEKVSGASKNRPALSSMLRFVRKGDVLAITKLDRLARSVADLTDIAGQLESKGVDLVVLDQQIDTTTPTGRLTFHLLGAIGEFERELIASRCSEGRLRAKEKGVRFGRKPVLSESQVASMADEIARGEIPKAEIARHYGISKTTLYRLYLASTVNRSKEKPQ